MSHNNEITKADRAGWAFYGLTIVVALVAGIYWYGFFAILLWVGLPAALVTGITAYWHRRMFAPSKCNPRELVARRFGFLGLLIAVPGLAILSGCIVASFKSPWLIWPCWLLGWLPVAISVSRFLNRHPAFHPRVLCPACGSFADPREPWECGHCGTENNNPFNHSFLQPCVRCGQLPRHMTCPTCKALIPLDAAEADPEDKHAARRKPNLPAITAELVPDHHQRLRQELSETDYAIVLTKRKAELARELYQLQLAQEALNKDAKGSLEDELRKKIQRVLAEKTALIKVVAEFEEYVRNETGAESVKKQRLTLIRQWRDREMLDQDQDADK